MEHAYGQSDQAKVWDLIKDAHTALLVTVEEDGALQARPMGCLQNEFDGTLFFLTFRHSSKLRQIRDDDRVLVAYVKPDKYEIRRDLRPGQNHRRQTEAERTLVRRIAGLVPKGA